MKIKIFVVLVICIVLKMIVSKQNELIKIPKEERKLISTSQKIVKGKVSRIIDGDSFIFEDGTKIRLFGIDAPELEQTCFLNIDIINKDTTKAVNKDGTNIVKQEEVKCGLNSKNKLIELTSDNEIKCLIKGKDVYERLVGECNFEKYNKKTKRKDLSNINKEMVISGNAIAFTQISDKYIEDENMAKSANVGIWETLFEIPSLYRKKINK